MAFRMIYKLCGFELKVKRKNFGMQQMCGFWLQVVKVGPQDIDKKLVVECYSGCCQLFFAHNDMI